jgi:hypothetical protein
MDDQVYRTGMDACIYRGLLDGILYNINPAWGYPIVRPLDDSGYLAINRLYHEKNQQIRSCRHDNPLLIWTSSCTPKILGQAQDFYRVSQRPVAVLFLVDTMQGEKLLFEMLGIGFYSVMSIMDFLCYARKHGMSSSKYSLAKAIIAGDQPAIVRSLQALREEIPKYILPLEILFEDEKKHLH